MGTVGDGTRNVQAVGRKERTSSLFIERLGAEGRMQIGWVPMMKRRIIKACGVCLCASTILLIGVSRSVTASETDLAYVDRRACGPRALYILLQMLETQGVGYDNFEEICVGSQGASLLALERKAQEFKANVETQRFPARRINRIPLPAIVHVKNPPEAVTDFHFLVVYGLEEDVVKGIDPTSGKKRNWSRAGFVDTWTGYALVPRIGTLRWGADWKGWSGVFGVVIAVLLGWLLKASWLLAIRKHHERKET